MFTCSHCKDFYHAAHMHNIWYDGGLISIFKTWEVKKGSEGIAFLSILLTSLLGWFRDKYLNLDIHWWEQLLNCGVQFQRLKNHFRYKQKSMPQAYIIYLCICIMLCLVNFGASDFFYQCLSKINKDENKHPSIWSAMS